MAGITIREAMPDDFEAIADFRNRIFNEVEGEYIEEEETGTTVGEGGLFFSPLIAKAT